MIFVRRISTLGTTMNSLRQSIRSFLLRAGYAVRNVSGLAASAAQPGSASRISHVCPLERHWHTSRVPEYSRLSDRAPVLTAVPNQGNKHKDVSRRSFYVVHRACLRAVCSAGACRGCPRCYSGGGNFRCTSPMLHPVGEHVPVVTPASPGVETLDIFAGTVKVECCQISNCDRSI